MATSSRAQKTSGMKFISIGLAVLLISCSRQPDQLKTIQQQKSGEYLVSVLNDTGVLKEHDNKLTLEVRNAATNELANVSNVKIQANMRMPGMAPMFGELSTPRQISPGRYQFDASFSMAGQWAFAVTFDPNGKAQFNLSAQ